MGKPRKWCSVRGGPGAKSKEYGAWRSMLARCKPTSHAYPYYGGRGIKVCAQWRDDFDQFFRDVGEAPSKKHTIDRINNDGDYEPGNVRWATWSVQSTNRRQNAHIVKEPKPHEYEIKPFFL